MPNKKTELEKHFPEYWKKYKHAYKEKPHQDKKIDTKSKDA